MDLYWYGQACFKIKGKNCSIVIDPFDPDFTGLKLPKLEADVILVTHDHHDHNNISAVNSTGTKPYLFTGPGEYEINGTVITGVSSFHDKNNGAERGGNTIFNILVDNLQIVHLGDLGQSELTEEQASQIDQSDILLIPVGGVYTIAFKDAASIVSQLEPKIVIPMHFKIDKLKFDLEGVDSFLKEMGAEGIEPQPKLSITKEKLPVEPEVVVLKPSS